MTEFFDGWYYKQQNAGRMLALIPGRTKDSAFIQVITNEAAYNVPYPVSAFKKGKELRVGNSLFSKDGISIDIRSEELALSGALAYKNLTPIAYDIMGPFRFFPMECRHTVVSMDHMVSGSLKLNGQDLDFNSSRGYIEGDSGTSFPSSYSWIQCNCFDEPCSVMVSVARIPLAGFRFTGCICVILFEGREYRLATYLGVRVVHRDRSRIELRQGKLRLCIDIEDSDGHSLFAPASGVMCRKINEAPVCEARFRFWRANHLLFDKTSRYASCEYV